MARTIRALLDGLPVPLGWAAVVAAVFGVAGGVIGLVIGLIVHPPTAWFAVFEIGVPSAILGFLVGLLAGGISLLVRRGTRRLRGSA